MTKPDISAITQRSNHGENRADTIVGGTINRNQSAVELEIQNTDGNKRLVPEEEFQRQDEDKLIEYWASFGQARERTIKCNTYRILEILGHKPGKPPRLQIHWVGYRADVATSEPLSKMLASIDASKVRDYLRAHKLTQRLHPTTDASPDATPSSAKKRPLTWDKPPAKRTRTSNVATRAPNSSSGSTPRMTQRYAASTAVGSDHTIVPPTDAHMPQAADPVANIEPTHPDNHLIRASSAPAPVEAVTQGVCQSRAYSLGSGASSIAANKALVVTDNRSPTCLASRPVASSTEALHAEPNAIRHGGILSNPATQHSGKRLPWQLLTAEDVTNLVSPEGQLDDNHINALFAMGAALSRSFVTIDSCLTSLQTSQRVGKTTTSQQIWCGKSTENRKIMCPLHVENHWVLLVLELDTRCATLYNSLEDLEAPIPKEFLAHIRRLIQHQLPVHPYQNPLEWSIKRAVCPRQQNSHDCGIYILALMLYILVEKHLPTQVNAFIWRHIFGYLCSSAPGDCAHDTINATIFGGAGLAHLGATSNEAILTNTTKKPIDDLMAKMEILKKFNNRLETIAKEIEDLREALSIFSLLRDRRESLLDQVRSCGIQLQQTINNRERTHKSLQDLDTLGAWTEDEKKSHETVMKRLPQSAKTNERWNDAIDDTCKRLGRCDLEIKSVLTSLAGEKERLVKRMKEWGQEALDHFILCL